ncbi:hypothetical protein [Streptomyces sp. NPDC060243]|uniref:hypothetical protein n=1 Tax=Streptomyces sp. NPDC060243 TaxID=3347081 RepID=UPI00364829A0
MAVQVGARDWCVQRLDAFDATEGMTPLREFLVPGPLTAAGFTDPTEIDVTITELHVRTTWAENAFAALRGADHSIGWEGDFQHEPYVGTLPWPYSDGWYLLVKQKNNGDTFLVSRGFIVPLLPTCPARACVIIRAKETSALGQLG